MKLEHLIQAYIFNKIPVKLDRTVEQQEERAGVIKFTEDINAAYLLDNEDIVIAMNMFINCVVLENKNINNQINHTINTINIMQKTIELLGNNKKEEANKILKELGLFNKKITSKAVRFLDYIYKIDATDGLLQFSIIEDNNHIPPVKSR